MKNIETGCQKRRRILIIPPAGLGDMIMAAPVIRALRQKFPDAWLAVLADYMRGAGEIGRCMSYLDEVIDFRLRRYSWGCVIKFFLSSYWPMLIDLRRKKFDTAVILGRNPIRTILVRMMTVKNILCVKGRGHPTRLGLDLVSKLGCSNEPLDFGFSCPDVRLEDILPKNTPRPWIGIHPFSAMNWREWSNFRDLAQKLKNRNGTVILLGKKAEHKQVEGLCDMVNKLSVKQLIAVIKNLDVLVSCDSGPMHIGFAVGTPTVAIFGPIAPQYRMPLTKSSRHQIVYDSDTYKDRYIQMKERYPEEVNLFENISADKVYEAVVRILAP
ncbi:MAG: glycosyltransferase family 9 protein [Planctomycetota bacterium]